MLVRSSTMQDYVVNKKIDELNPIPSNWTTEQKNDFLDSGYLPMAGMPPTSNTTYQTKKITVEELHYNLSKRLSTMVVAGAASLTEDGTFNVNRVRSAGAAIEVVGSQIVINPGWYQYTAHAEVSYNGSALNLHDRIYLDCNWHAQSNSCDFDFSEPHTETIELCGLVHNASSTAENVTLSVRGIPTGVSEISVTLSQMSIEEVRVNDA